MEIEIPRKPRAVATISAEPHVPEGILGILLRSHPNLPSSDWKVVKVFDPESAKRKAIVVLIKETLPLLRGTNGQVYYGFLGIRLVVYRGDDKHDCSADRKSAGTSEATAASEIPKLADDEAAVSVTSGSSQTTLVGHFLQKLDVADEDALLEVDEAEVDFDYDPDEDGEGNTD